LLLQVGDTATKMGPGKASRIWVEAEGGTIQVNYLAEGAKAKVSKVIGGARHRQEMEEVGLKEGVEITLVGKEVSEALPRRMGNYVLAQIGEQVISIGRGMAEKVWVE